MQRLPRLCIEVVELVVVQSPGKDAEHAQHHQHRQGDEQVEDVHLNGLYRAHANELDPFTLSLSKGPSIVSLSNDLSLSKGPSAWLRAGFDKALLSTVEGLGPTLRYLRASGRSGFDRLSPNGFSSEIISTQQRDAAAKRCERATTQAELAAMPRPAAQGGKAPAKASGTQARL
jgi:hypothetical protein